MTCGFFSISFNDVTFQNSPDFWKNILFHRSEPVPSCNIPVSHLVTFDLNKDLLPLILAHRNYDMQADQGTKQTFNLMALQRQIEERFVRGRPKLDPATKQLVFRQDLQDVAVFEKLRKNIPQV